MQIIQLFDNDFQEVSIMNNLQSILDQRKAQYRAFPMSASDTLKTEFYFLFSDILEGWCETPTAKEFIQRGTLATLEGRPNGANWQIFGVLHNLAYIALTEIAKDLNKQNKNH